MRRTRRTPDEARSIILNIASIRLAKHGIKGLNVKDIALDAGINHATILHHFGNAEGMRIALLNRMSKQLIIEMVAILNADTPADTLFVQLFSLMSQSGHIKLFAWRAMDEADNKIEPGSKTTQDLFSEIVLKVTEKLDNPDIKQVRNVIMLALSSAIGWGICAKGFEEVMGTNALGMSEEDQQAFPAWVGSVLPTVV